MSDNCKEVITLHELKQAQLASISDFGNGHGREPLRLVVGIKCVVLLFLTVSKVGWCVRFVNVDSGRLWRQQIVLFFFLLFLSGETAPAVEEYKWWLLALIDISLNCEFMFGTAIFLTSLCGNWTSDYIHIHTNTHKYFLRFLRI